MFQFSAFASDTYAFSAGYPPKRVGFPIQKSQDRSLFASSPELIAGYHVFHRLLMPSHPPRALGSFITPTEHRSRRIAAGRDQFAALSQRYTRSVQHNLVVVCKNAN